MPDINLTYLRDIDIHTHTHTQGDPTSSEELREKAQGIPLEKKIM